jgi:hypothetical protein
MLGSEADHNAKFSLDAVSKPFKAVAPGAGIESRLDSSNPGERTLHCNDSPAVLDPEFSDEDPIVASTPNHVHSGLHHSKSFSGSKLFGDRQCERMNKSDCSTESTRSTVANRPALGAAARISQALSAAKQQSTKGNYCLFSSVCI